MSPGLPFPTGGNLGESCVELERRLAALFHAVDGPPRAFFELGYGPTEPFRVIYKTWALGYVSSLSAEEMERQLCERMWNDLCAKIEFGEDVDGMLLFWRRRPRVVVEPGRMIGQLVVKVRMRFAIPSLDLSGVDAFKVEGDPIVVEPLPARAG